MHVQDSITTSNPRNHRKDEEPDILPLSSEPVHQESLLASRPLSLHPHVDAMDPADFIPAVKGQGLKLGRVGSSGWSKIIGGDGDGDGVREGEDDGWDEEEDEQEELMVDEEDDEEEDEYSARSRRGGKKRKRKGSRRGGWYSDEDEEEEEDDEEEEQEMSIRSRKKQKKQQREPSVFLTDKLFRQQIKAAQASEDVDDKEYSAPFYINKKLALYSGDRIVIQRRSDYRFLKQVCCLNVDGPEDILTFEFATLDEKEATPFTVVIGQFLIVLCVVFFGSWFWVFSLSLLHHSPILLIISFASFHLFFPLPCFFCHFSHLLLHPLSFRG